MLISELGMAVSQLALGIYFYSLAQILEYAPSSPPLVTAAPPPLAASGTTTLLPETADGSTDYSPLFNTTHRSALHRFFRKNWEILQLEYVFLSYVARNIHCKENSTYVFLFWE
jgi:hypothetical protein